MPELFIGFFHSLSVLFSCFISYFLSCVHSVNYTDDSVVSFQAH